MHRQPLDVLRRLLDPVLLDLALVLVDFQQAALNQIIEVVVAPHASGPLAVALLQLLEKSPLLAIGVKHGRVKEGANVPVVVFKALEDQERGYDDEDLHVSNLELFGELPVLLGRGLDGGREAQQLLTLLRVNEIG